MTSRHKEKTMWGEIEAELQNVQIKGLGYDHPNCSCILDNTTSPVSDISKERILPNI